MLILDLWGITFHAVVVFALGKNFLFKSALGHCVLFVPYFSTLKLLKLIYVSFLMNKTLYRLKIQLQNATSKNISPHCETGRE